MRDQPGDPDISARDRGLQPERTALAWQRTALSMAGAALIVTRLTIGSLGVVTVVVLAFCLGHAALLFRHARRRHGIDTATSRRQPRSVGLHGALLAFQVVLLALLEVASLVASSPM